MPELAQNVPRKIGKPRLISMSQKINTIIDFFRYYGNRVSQIRLFFIEARSSVYGTWERKIRFFCNISNVNLTKVPVELKKTGVPCDRNGQSSDDSIQRS